MFAPSSPAPGDGGRRSLVLLGLGAAIGLALAATSILRPEPTRILPADDETIASVNGQDISRSEYLRAVDAIDSTDSAAVVAQLKKMKLQQYLLL